MTQLITAAEVVAIAFTDGEYIPQGCIAQSDIDAAVERWVKPVVGKALLEAIEQGSYAELKESYLKPVVALYTRLVVQPRLNVSTSPLGLTVASSSSRKGADEAARRELRLSIKERAHFLRQRLIEYIEEHSDEIAEYDKSKNILNRCRCDGGFVQIH